MALDHTLTPGVDWILPLVSVPSIEDGKLFFVVFRVNDPVNRLVMPVYMDWWSVKYKWYNVSALTDLYKYDEVALNDVASIFNTLFELTDDIGKVVQKTWLDILVYGGDVVIGNEQETIADTDITLTDNTTNFIVLDYADNTLKAVETLPDAYYQFATIVTSGGAITSLVRKRAFNVQDFFSALFFEKDTNGEIIIKDWAITGTQIDFTSFDADYIFNGATNQFVSPLEKQNIADNTTARHTHANKSLLDTYDQLNANIADAVTKKHTHINKSTLDLIPDIGGAADWEVMIKMWSTIVRWPGGGGSGWTTAARTDIFVGDGVANTFTLSHVPLNDNVIFMQNDSWQAYFHGIDYSRSGQVITFSQLPENGRNIYVRYFQQIDIAQVWETNTMINLPWTGIGTYKQKSGVEFQMRRIDGINGITVTQVWDQVIIDGHVSVWPGGEANTASNVGAGVWLYKNKSWVDLRFKTLISDPTILLTEDPSWDEIQIVINEAVLQKRYYMHRMY